MGYALSHDTRQTQGPSAALLGKWKHILTQKCPDATSTPDEVQNWVTLLCRSQGHSWHIAKGLAATIPWDGRGLILRLNNSMDSVRFVFEGTGLLPQPEARSIFRDMCTFIQVGAPLEKESSQYSRFCLF